MRTSNGPDYSGIVSGSSGSSVPKRYLVEAYWPGVTDSDVARLSRRLRLAARELRPEDEVIRHRTTLFIGEDEAVLFLMEASSAATVSSVCRLAELRFDRIVEVVELRHHYRSAIRKG